MLGSKQAADVSLAFPVPAPPPRPISSFPFPPPPSHPHAVTTKVPREARPMWMVPDWVPVPLEAFVYFAIGTILGTIIMLGVVKLIRPAHRANPSDAAMVDAPHAAPHAAAPVAVAARP